MIKKKNIIQKNLLFHFVYVLFIYIERVWIDG